MTETTQNDISSVDMAPFFARHDRRTRLTFNAMIVISLALSVAIYLRFRVNASVLDEVPPWPSFLVLAIIVAPFSILALWIAGKWYGKSRPPAQPDGSFPMGADDARNVARVANAGAVFVTGYGLVMIAIQLFWALRMFGIVPPTDPAATGPGFRAVLLAVAGLMIYFGNVGPRMPIPRAPEDKPAVRMKYNRLSSWMTVVFGALLGVAALFAPANKLVDAVGGLSMLLVAVMAVGTIMYYRALKSPTAR
jgi:hypothetical protein